MKTLLIKNARVLVTMDQERRELKEGALYAVDGVITAVGNSGELPQDADRVLDLSGHIVLPGLVNTHHHLYQTLTRTFAQDEPLFPWLQSLYPVWSHLTPEAIKVSAQVGIAELLLSGCTTTSDHLYLFPNGSRLDDSIEGAMEMGIRFHATRGSMSIGESDGGLPPDSLVENEKAILKDSQRLIETYHDGADGSRIRIALAPCSPFSVSRDLMRESALLARSYGVGLHTHLAENVEDILYSQEKFGLRPGDYAEELGWVGNDVWHAHCVQLNPDEISLFARTGTGVAHCPCSNMRLGSGIAPVREMYDAGVKVGLGVDGSASNDSSHLLAEARQSMLLQRVKHGARGLKVREAIEIATLGGAKVLNRSDVGVLAPGYQADFAAFKLDELYHSGAELDPVAGLLLCHPVNANYTAVGGELLVSEGRITRLDLQPLLRRHRNIAIDLANKAA
ncbi:8-oxoguanine deaminase [Kiloniella laminariae]|uniref:8-oxoguanine deaminase n=1 Tax=Kiloniella laminariae TaxID=454162 RepID=A0ABT4LGN3_9PROT|nr:8-oxoguanine deaminase [Kiloniella laminariae]MCZ4280263.1 8-oxoguanine deaminase [Kiloniella laminariae]